MIFAPTPISVDFFILPTSTTLLDVEMTSLFIQIDRSLAAIAPDDALMCLIDFDLHKKHQPPTDRVAWFTPP